MILLMDNQIESQETSNLNPSFLSKLKIFLSANKFATIFITVLGVISFATTTYLLMANKKAPLSNKSFQENIVPTSTMAPSPQKIIPTNTQPPSTPTPTIVLTNPTATWSAFTSSKYSYSIKYPPNWNAQITAQQDPKILEYVVFNPVATKAGTLSITLSYGTRTYAQALALDPQAGESMIVASASATKKNSKDSNGYKAVNVIVPFGLNTIIFNAKDAYLSLFNQMLTTLKLTK